MLERRVEALESGVPSDDDHFLILRVMRAPGELSREIAAAELLGVRFTRCNDESEDNFVDRLRAFAIANRKPGQYGARGLVGTADLMPGK